ncbi:MAG TPA: PAS domain S-box protein [Candidatus Udaeobacter sp.]
MKSEEKEEQLLKSVALQTANAVLVARRRAAQELVEIKEALERKSTELTHSLTMLNATLESTADAILVTDENGRVITWNQKFLEIWPIASELIASREHRKLQKTRVKQFTNPKAFRERIAEIYKNEPEETFDVLETIDGKVFERYSKIQCVEERNVGRVWSYRDITERKQAQEAEAHLAAIVESSDDAIISKDLNSIITSWNRGAERLFGYTAQEAIGQSVTMLMPPERFDEEVGILERIRRGESIDHYETLRRRKDGTLLHISLTVSPITNRNGRIVGASKIAHDISERKQAEAEREQLLASERHALERAEAEARMKDEFLASLSHELRTPLNAIFGWANILRTSDDSVEIAEGLEIIERNARAQTKMIEDLLDMSRIISGKVRLDVQRVDLTSVINSTIESVKPMAAAKQIRLTSVLDPVAGPVSGDPARLQQILWNLLTNALKFTQKSGRVHVVLERINSQLEISVHDNGRGIPPDFLPYVFHRFRQADASTTREQRGLGLGLAIVKNLTELHGGSVSAKSPGVNKGATFIIALPMVMNVDADPNRRHPSTIGHERFAETLHLDGVRVLAVDDEADARHLIKRILSGCGAHVQTADSGEAARHFLREKKPDVLIMDIGMPNEDGYEAIAKVRQLPREQGGKVPAIALTAFARSEDRRRAILNGFQMHVAKPVEPSELIAMVASLAGRTESYHS